MNLPGAGCWASVPEDRKRKSLYQGMHLSRYALLKKEEKIGPGILMLKMERNKLWTYAKALEENLYTCLFLKTAWSLWAGVHLKIDHIVVQQQQKCIWAVNKLLYV